MEMVSSKGPRAILVFSRAAEHGSVKTRLRPAIGDDGCLALHLAMLQDTLDCCAASGTPVALYVAGDAGLPFTVPVPVRRQSEGDLGLRMQRAFEENLATFEKVVIVGTDAPGLTPSIIEEAFEAMERKDLVLGPSKDGGYYLIGLRRMIPEIFANIPWSGPEVLKRTLAHAPADAAHLLPALFDVDVPGDLERLEREIGVMPQARRTREWFASRRAR